VSLGSSSLSNVCDWCVLVGLRFYYTDAKFIATEMGAELGIDSGWQFSPRGRIPTETRPEQGGDEG
jgi:hypothetical protein